MSRFLQKRDNIWSIPLHKISWVLHLRRFYGDNSRDFVASQAYLVRSSLHEIQTNGDHDVFAQWVTRYSFKYDFSCPNLSVSGVELSNLYMNFLFDHYTIEEILLKRLFYFIYMYVCLWYCYVYSNKLNN